MSGDAAKRLFTSVWFDWYRTNASEPYASKDPEVTADTALVNGGLRYKAKTDGHRNDLYERYHLAHLRGDAADHSQSPVAARRKAGR
jgi:hypothetical protein